MKKLLSSLVLVLLSASVCLATTVNIAGKQLVTTEAGLITALADADIKEIGIAADISASAARDFSSKLLSFEGGAILTTTGQTVTVKAIRDPGNVVCLLGAVTFASGADGLIRSDWWADGDTTAATTYANGNVTKWIKSDGSQTLRATASSPTYGSNLITNGDFASGDFTGWTAGAGWSVASNKALHTAGSTETLAQDIAVTNGTTYQIEWADTGGSAGTYTFSIGSVVSRSYSYSEAAGAKRTTIVASGTSTQTFAITPATGYNGNIDDVTVRAITAWATPATNFNNSDNSASVEIRTGGASLYNTFVGDDAGYKNTTGFNNSAQGYAALYSNTTGYQNSAQGVSALYSNTTGGYNSAQGYQALASNTTGGYNSAQGVSALYSNTTGGSNSAYGYQALYFNTTASSNTAQGAYALYSNTEGSYNSVHGHGAIYSNTTGSYNSALGYRAGRYITGGATANETSGTSVYLGAATKAAASGDANEIVIGYDATGLGSNTVVLGNSSITTTALRGNTGVGTESPVSAFEVEAGLTTTGAVFSLGTKEPTVVANDVLGHINFYAPLEADGTDAILPGASIVAVAEDTFAADNNKTSLRFQTGASETATTKMAVLYDGTVGIGTTAVGTGGAAALGFGNGTKPASLSNVAGLFAADSGGTTELFSFDEAGNETQQTAHAGDAPAWMYDDEDGIPMIVREVQYYAGYVRYTNNTRMARMAGMLDEEKKLLPAEKRTCIFKETFAEHQARTGNVLVQENWEDSQDVIAAQKAAEIAVAENRKSTLETEIPALEAEIAGLETEVSTLADEITPLQSEASKLEADIATLKTEVDAVGAEIADLEKTVSTTTSEIATLESEVTDLTAKEEPTADDATALGEKTATLDEKKGLLTTTNGLLEEKKAALEVLNTQADEKRTSLTAVNAQITEKTSLKNEKSGLITTKTQLVADKTKELAAVVIPKPYVKKAIPTRLDAAVKANEVPE